MYAVPDYRSIAAAILQYFSCGSAVLLLKYCAMGHLSELGMQLAQASAHASSDGCCQQVMFSKRITFLARQGAEECVLAGRAALQGAVGENDSHDSLCLQLEISIFAL